MDPPNNPIELEKQSCHGKKVLLVCKILQNPPTKMTPKEFMFHFVSSENSKITYLRRYWSTNTGVKQQWEVTNQLSLFSILNCCNFRREKINKIGKLGKKIELFPFISK
ncbi:hypothetical protein PSTT_03516 [Puccinia striiformis]|uniref:Uncharacterized protein n=1 Tax=Puccinia striiformis TaxID=27350 RepID=A0A2S4VWH0_9BASI|nr:hypothetical protein PSTT_03516 [Puccinia striiformis]